MTTAGHEFEPVGQALPAGTRIEEFVIERLLGSGGFGITYLARDTSLGRHVVIKENLPTQFAWRETTTGTVRPRHTTGGDVEDYEWSMKNFLREAETLASLDHPGIVRVLRKFEANGTAYFVMPFVEGVPFDDLLGQRQNSNEPFADHELRGVLDRLLDALAHLHDRGIYHRDIKPANIIITMNGVPMLIDFGSARQRLTERSMTVIESPGYTPFEQLQSHGKIGPWSDVYALGATIAKAATFESLPKSADRILSDPHVPLAERSELKERLSVDLLLSVDKATRVSWADRWQDCSAWRDHLNSASTSGLDAGTHSTGSAPNESAVSRATSVTRVPRPRPAAPPVTTENALPQALAARRTTKQPLTRKAAAVAIVFGVIGLLAVTHQIFKARTAPRVSADGSFSDRQTEPTPTAPVTSHGKDTEPEPESRQPEDRIEVPNGREALTEGTGAVRDLPKSESPEIGLQEPPKSAIIKSEPERSNLPASSVTPLTSPTKNAAEMDSTAGQPPSAQSNKIHTDSGGDAPPAPAPVRVQFISLPRSPVIDRYNLHNPNTHKNALVEAKSMQSESVRLSTEGMQQSQTRDYVSPITGRYSSAEDIRRKGAQALKKSKELASQAGEIRSGVQIINTHLKELAKSMEQSGIQELESNDGKIIRAKVLGAFGEGIIIAMADGDFMFVELSRLSADTASKVRQMLTPKPTEPTSPNAKEVHQGQQSPSNAPTLPGNAHYRMTNSNNVLYVGRRGGKSICTFEALQPMPDNVTLVLVMNTRNDPSAGSPGDVIVRSPENGPELARLKGVKRTHTYRIPLAVKAAAKVVISIEAQHSDGMKLKSFRENTPDLYLEPGVKP